MALEQRDGGVANGLETSSQRSDTEVFTRSWDQNMNIWLRNMTGTEYGLGSIIRILAEKASLGKRKLEVLEVIEGIPLKSLELRGVGFRSRGDFLIYGPRGAHAKTEIGTTVVSKKD